MKITIEKRTGKNLWKPYTSVETLTEATKVLSRLSSSKYRICVDVRPMDKETVDMVNTYLRRDIRLRKVSTGC